MTFLIVFACTAAAAFLLKPAIKKVPVAWYVSAGILMVLYVAGLQGWLPLPAPVRSVLFLLLQKGTLAVALFAVVMFIGALPRDSGPRKHLMPIRAELSIIACILVCGHIVAYCLSYVPRMMGAGGVNPFVAVGLAVAAAITVLLVVLGVTSFNSVKARMSKQIWVKVQKWAYVFFGLTYVHVLAMLLPSALGGGAAAVQSVAAYTVVFGAYAVLRVARAKRESGGCIKDPRSQARQGTAS